MHRKHIIATILAGACALAACADTGTTTGIFVTGASGCTGITGNFVATSFNATSTANSTVRQDLLGGGGNFAVDFTGTNFTSTFFGASDSTATTSSGAFTSNGGSLTLGNQTLFTGGSNGSQLFTCSLLGNTLTLTSNNTNFVFPGTTTAQPATITITLNRST